MAEHPGQVKMIDVFEETEELIPVEQVPEAQRFVYLRDGKPSDPERATEQVPVVEVRMLSLDDAGELVPKEDATKLIIQELGPDGRPLRSTTMLRDQSRKEEE